MRTKLEDGMRRVRNAAMCVVSMGLVAVPLRADHPGHGGHEGLLGGIYHNLVEIGLVVLLVAIVAALLREAKRRTG